MDFFSATIWINGKFLGIEWHFWKMVGWLGNLVFFSRFFVQWLATERSKRVVVPPAFWWLSLFGSLCLLAYGLYRQDSVFIFAYLFTWIPYIRNLVIAHRHRSTEIRCHACDSSMLPTARYCSACGASLRNPPISINRSAPVSH